MNLGPNEPRESSFFEFSKIFDLSRFLKEVQKPKNFPRHPDSNLMLGAEPFQMGTGKEAVLLIHGWTSTPREMRPVAEVLQNRFYCEALLLKGHGTSWQDLENTQSDHHLQQIFEAYDRLSSQFSTIHAVGLSYGAMLCLHLAYKRKLGKVVLLAPFYESTSKLAGKIPFTTLLPFFPSIIRLIPKTGPGPINDPFENKDHLAYHTMPLRPLKSLIRCIGEIKIKLPQINNPTVIIHSKEDQTASFAGGQKLFQKLGSPKKSLVELQKSNHIITRDYDKSLVLETISRFL